MIAPRTDRRSLRPRRLRWRATGRHRAIDRGDRLRPVAIAGDDPGGRNCHRPLPHKLCLVRQRAAAEPSRGVVAHIRFAVVEQRAALERFAVCCRNLGRGCHVRPSLEWEPRRCRRPLPRLLPLALALILVVGHGLGRLPHPAAHQFLKIGQMPLVNAARRRSVFLAQTGGHSHHLAHAAAGAHHPHRPEGIVRYADVSPGHE